MEAIAYIIIAVILILPFMLSSGKRKRGSQKSQDQMDVEEVEKNAKRMDSVGVFGLLTPEELADEANYRSKYSENSYIQNNTRPIAKEVSVLTPSFNGDSFIRFAKDIFKRLVDSHGSHDDDPIVADTVSVLSLPSKIDGFEMCYLHNYIVKSKNESLKVLVSAVTGGQIEKYFLVFSRENPAISVTKGEPIAISCPNCGGNITFAAKHMITNCPYCNNVITFAEYDWKLVLLEHISGDTEICNRAVIKE